MKTLHNFFRADFTQSADYLLSVTQGPLDEETAISIAALLGEFDPTEEGKGQWVATGDGDYTLDEAQVIYVGENNEDLPTHPLFKHAVGISLRPDADGPRRLYLQFNDSTE